LTTVITGGAPSGYRGRELALTGVNAVVAVVLESVFGVTSRDACERARALIFLQFSALR